MYAYCYFCETQKCATIAALIRRTLNDTCFSPEIIQRKWTKGVCEEVRYPWLPGYIFHYTEEPQDHPIYLPGIIRRLGDGELRNEDLAFANMLYERNGVMGSIHLVKDGQYCTMYDPLWREMEGKVIKLDRGRKRCCVEFSFDGIRRTIWLGYDLIQPNENDNYQKQQ